MLAIIIPTLNSETSLNTLLEQLRGHADRIVVSDGISNDDSLKTAASHRAVLTIGQSGRGRQLARGADWAANAKWLLFLHADSELPDNWQTEVNAHLHNYPEKAAYFKLRFDSPKLSARFVEFMVRLRCLIFALPYGDQGLLISRELYDDIDGYPDWPLFEDVNIIEKIGRNRLKSLPATITTSAEKYERDGFVCRGWRNLKLLRRYKKGEVAHELLKTYE